MKMNTTQNRTYTFIVERLVFEQTRATVVAANLNEALNTYNDEILPAIEDGELEFDASDGLVATRLYGIERDDGKELRHDLDSEPDTLRVGDVLDMPRDKLNDASFI